MEAWGDAILKAGARNWSSIKGGKRAVVEAITVRNLFAHGLPAFNQKTVNRIAAASNRLIALEAGDPITLNKKAFTTYTSTLRTFARLLADGVTNLPDGAPEPGTRRASRAIATRSPMGLSEDRKRLSTPSVRQTPPGASTSFRRACRRRPGMTRSPTRRRTPRQPPRRRA